MQYLRLCKDTYDTKGILIPADTSLKDLYKQINCAKANYISIFQFNEDHFKQFKETGSVAGISDVTTTRLTWDFDDAEDPEKSRADALKLIYELKKRGFRDSQILIFFSGSKGYEVTLLLKNQYLTPREAKNIASNLAAGLKTFDPSVYNATRIFRIPLTRHNKSGLIKSPLSVEGLTEMTTEEIKEFAKDPNLTFEDLEDAWELSELTADMIALKNAAPTIEMIKLTTKEDLDISSVDWGKKPRDLTFEKYLISLGFFSIGNRSKALIILASTLKNLGWNETQVYYACKAAADLQARRTGDEKFPKEEIHKNIIEQVFGANWKGGSFSVKDDPLLQELSLLVPSEIRMTTSDANIVSIGESFQAFCEYAKEIDKNTIKFGIPALDDLLSLQTGRLYGILANPGVGKTTFGIEVVYNTSLSGEPSMFASYDMSCPDVIQKLIQKHTKFKSKEIYKIFKENQQDKIKEFQEILNKNYKNVTFIFKTGQSIDDLKRSILEREKQLGAPIRLVVVDYLELIQSKFSDPTQASMESIQGLREIAVGMNKAVIVMLQPSKSGSSIDEPLLSYNSAKGSSSIAQAVTAMLTLHRPGYSSRTPENDKFMGIDCVKNRSGGLFSLDLHFDGATGNLRALEKIEHEELNDLREAKKNAQQATRSDNY